MGVLRFLLVVFGRFGRFSLCLLRLRINFMILRMGSILVRILYIRWEVIHLEEHCSNCRPAIEISILIARCWAQSPQSALINSLKAYPNPPQSTTSETQPNKSSQPKPGNAATSTNTNQLPPHPIY